LRQTRLLYCGQQLRYGFVACIFVGTQVQLWHGQLFSRRLQTGLQFGSFNFFIVPVHNAVLIDGELNGFRLGERCRTLCVGQVQLNGVGKQGRGDDKNDQQHQHDINERYDVNVRQGSLMRMAMLEATECHAVSPWAAPVGRLPSRWHAGHAQNRPFQPAL
jgi:hypothetical protein